MNNVIFVVALGLLMPFSSLAFKDTLRLKVGVVADLLNGRGRVPAEQKKIVKELKEKVGLSNYKIPVRNTNVLIKFFWGWRSAFALFPGVFDRLYINKEWLEELTPDEQAFLISCQLIDIKNYTGLKKWAVKFIAKAFQKKYKMFYIPLDLLENYCLRLLEAETDKEAVKLLNTTEGAINLFYEMAYAKHPKKSSWYRSMQISGHNVLYPIATLPVIKWFQGTAPYGDRASNIQDVLD
ncbi:hypothetical protein H0X48_06800 [Candidatus Dependentiae bacterium]|nr:hypothetical protein [Candidatus Dependentiae bacterium]